MTDEINKKRIEYFKQHCEQVDQICDGCVLDGHCDQKANLLCMWLPKDYKCKKRKFCEKAIKKAIRKMKKEKECAL